MPPRALPRASLAGTAALLVLSPGLLVASVPSDAGSGSTSGLQVTLPARAGSDPALTSGTALPLDLAVTNPYAVPVAVVALEVRVGDVRPRSANGCRPGDFTATPAGFTRLEVPARTTTTLSAAGVPAGQWPRLGLAPEATDGGCRDRQVSLSFSARGRFR